MSEYQRIIPVMGEEHPEECDCDVCGYEMHSAHVTIRFPGLSEKVRQAEEQVREANSLGILCAECFELCVLSEDKKRWMCPNGHN